MNNFSGVNSWMLNGQVSLFNQPMGTVNTQQGNMRGVTGYTPPERNDSPGQERLNAQQARDYMAALRDAGSRLTQSVQQMTQRGATSLFESRTASSSDTNVLTASNGTNGTRGPNFNDVSVTVSQVASGQTNTGTAQPSMALSGAEAGRHTFSIEREDGRSAELNVTVTATDTNRTVQQRMADAINRNNELGLTAAVRFNDREGTSQLVISSNTTGERQAFNIQDISGDLVSRTGADNVTQEAANAQFTVNGEARESEVNTVDLGGSLTATLRQVSDRPVQIRALQNSGEIFNAVREIASQYNELLETARSNPNDRGAQQLMRRLESTARAYESALGRAGIGLGSDGFLRTNDERIAAAVESGQVQNVFGAQGSLGTENGFMRSLNTIAEQAEAQRFAGAATRVAARETADEPNLAAQHRERIMEQFREMQQNMQRSNPILQLFGGF
jgi:hypothetical protein